jgi:glutamyl-Q tRNA(Asp) synthetase
VSGVNASTAIATTATASSNAAGTAYRGRFAPSPTGRLHLGSLVAALGSWLEARHHGGQWLIRIEDIDTPRVQAGLADAILRCLAAHGLESDGPVLWQSTRYEAYAAAVDLLRSRDQAYACGCSRKDSGEGPYAGTCRQGPQGMPPYAWRLAMPAFVAEFRDGLQGLQRPDALACSDPVVQRRDGLPAYQLAVVLDDAAQGITHVVRGADLLGSTFWQLALQKALELPTPHHLHLPVVTEADGRKLSKSASAQALETTRPELSLWDALALLRQAPPPELRGAPVVEQLDWAARHWRTDPLRKLLSVPTAALLCGDPR